MAGRYHRRVQQEVQQQQPQPGAVAVQPSPSIIEVTNTSTPSVTSDTTGGADDDHHATSGDLVEAERVVDPADDVGDDDIEQRVNERLAQVDDTQLRQQILQDAPQAHHVTIVKEEHEKKGLMLRYGRWVGLLVLIVCPLHVEVMMMMASHPQPTKVLKKFY